MPRSGQKNRVGYGEGLAASMRPGQSCPGVAGSREAIQSRLNCFNEAGAIMPRSGPPAALDLTEADVLQ